MGSGELGFEAGWLRDGAGQHARAGVACAAVSDALTGITMSAAIFGSVPAAAGFHAAGVEVRDGQRRDAAAEAGRRRALAVRAQRAAAIGDRLIVDTAALARAAAPAPPGDRS